MNVSYTFDELIPAAILFDNPGIAKQEFADRLAETSSGGSFKTEDPWDSRSRIPSFNFRYHRGVPGLPHVLNLNIRDEFSRFYVTKKDEFGLDIDPPMLDIINRNMYGEYEGGEPHYKVSIHEKHKIGRPRKLSFYTPGKYTVGDQISNADYGIHLNTQYPKRIVNSVISKVLYEKDDGGITDYEVMAKTLRKVKRFEEHQGLSSLFDSWPQFRPEFQYDFGQTSGHFSTYLSSGLFRWIMKDDAYYLDPITFDLIPAGLSASGASFDNNGFDDRRDLKEHEIDSQFMNGYGYTDLVITAEAIKQKAWKMFSLYGLEHLADFLKDFPDSRDRIHQAIWIAHTSLSAKRQQITNSELLRMQLFSGSSVDPRSFDVRIATPPEDN